ncbi:RNA-dependent RNA polymerase [Forsythia ovata]|uniref:RNA-dependent RNA polymerase n=1 Tax=Forsythia ovata TaxID=205694 RepID=A0ABD1VKU2_9LAMI
MKGEYITFKELMHREPGIGINPDNHMIDASPEWWDRGTEKLIQRTLHLSWEIAQSLPVKSSLSTINWKFRGHGKVQFDTPETKNKALLLSQQKKLFCRGSYLSLFLAFDDITGRPLEPKNRVGDSTGVVLFVGMMIREDCFGILESWDCRAYI